MNKVILLGDLHFGMRRFSLPFLENQLKLFNEQVFPYMIENNISEIYQFGDLTDNRVISDTIWLETLKRDFFEKLAINNFTLYTLLGNHDIAYRESRDISLVESISQIYPNNFKIFKERTTINLCGRKTYIVPWLVKGESLSHAEIHDKEIIFGHFEIRNFAMVKGHIDVTSPLTEEFFKSNTLVDRIFSGHYHLKNTKSDIKYLGTPFQLNWNDSGENKGFYVWDGMDLDFIENTTTKKFIKVKYDDSGLNNKNIEIEGLFNHKIYVDDEELKLMSKKLENHELKFFINKAKDRHFDEVLYSMKEMHLQPAIINNQEISDIIGLDYMVNFKNESNSGFKNTRELIIEAVQEIKVELMDVLMDILIEIESNKTKENQ